MSLPKFSYALVTQSARSHPLVALALWPTSVFLMATEGHEHELSSFVILATTIAGNAIAYMVLFTLFWVVGWILRASFSSLCDGTTI